MNCHFKVGQIWRETTFEGGSRGMKTGPGPLLYFSCWRPCNYLHLVCWQSLILNVSNKYIKNTNSCSNHLIWPDMPLVILWGGCHPLGDLFIQVIPKWVCPPLSPPLSHLSTHSPPLSHFILTFFAFIHFWAPTYFLAQN